MCTDWVLEKKGGGGKGGGKGGSKAANTVGLELSASSRYRIYTVLTHALLTVKVFLKVAHGIGTKMNPFQQQCIVQLQITTSFSNLQNSFQFL